MNVIASGKGAKVGGEAGGEEGEEIEVVPDEEETFTYVEEVKRQIYREDKKKQKVDDFTKAKENCEYCCVRFPFSFSLVVGGR